MKKFLLIFALTAALLSLASCGGGGDDTTSAMDTTLTPDPDTIAPVVTTQPATEEPITEEPKITEETAEPPATTADDKYHMSSSFVPESDEVSSDYFNDAIFIGDSRTQGFLVYSGVRNGNYIAFPGMTVRNFFTESYLANGVTATAETRVRALKGQYSKVYIMLGLNELGWSYYSVFEENLSKLIDFIKSETPDVTIYLQTVFPVSKERESQVSYESKKNIGEINGIIIRMAEEKSVYLLDIHSAYADSEGYLPADMTYDGVHLNRAPYSVWVKYLLTHTVKSDDAAYYYYRVDN